MKNPFKTVAAVPPSEAERALENWGIIYEKKPDGSILVPKGLDIYGKRLPVLPDLSSITVVGDFCCSGNWLTSLKGAPASVSGDFYCARNHLTSLEGAPTTIGGSFYCDSNWLTSLKGAPASVGGSFFCRNNQLISLEGAPQKFKSVVSDFGEFKSWNDVPEELRLSPETRDKAILETTILQKNMRVSKPLRFRK